MTLGTFPGSSMVEHSAVNRRVASSNLARGANFSRHLSILCSLLPAALRLGNCRSFGSRCQDQLAIYVICVNIYALCVHQAFSTLSFPRPGRSSYRLRSCLLKNGGTCLNLLLISKLLPPA